MEKLLILDSCMREDSRTARILAAATKSLSDRYEIGTIRLGSMEMPSVGPEMLEERGRGKVPEWAVEAAHRVAEADRIVIAAPFWDMSFPARLKVFFEHVSLYGITFTDTGKTCEGLCRCQKVLYITTRGMNIRTGDALEQATPYLKALSQLWGLGEIYAVAAENLDYSTPDEVEAKIAEASQEVARICVDF
ncbi:MAG: NAD(P)H-dependent oxidoreductase [Bacteroidales bacterium]|nr:NAD(P)H-dependent oxidoreductase [Bacteroides sp.]MCM1199393.1 NAD(P)H-dependent oxidoreductase [Clostridium sp.]MCM1502845.1 NAD(P)H-dependent oxidoreductase [Bacteroidales bacterium]